MIRIAILFLCISCALAFPSWFHDYVKEHKKQYSVEQMDVAFSVLKPKYDYIQKNNGNLHLRLHKNSDKKRKINRRLHEMKKRASPTSFQDEKKKKLNMPLEFDWRLHGTVTGVEEQGDCGGCYCFAGIHNLEHHYKKKTGVLKKLSVQECIDCTNSKIKYASGCDGGLMEDLYTLAKQWPIEENKYDRFKMRNSFCPRRKPPHGIKVKQYKVMSDDLNSPIEDELAHNLLKYGPIPVGIDSKTYNFELYRHGIIKASHCGKEIDHAVTVTGFGIEGSTRYWVIKNSWGKSWGESGYFRLERGKNACGINSYSSFATSVEVV